MLWKVGSLSAARVFLNLWLQLLAMGSHTDLTHFPLSVACTCRYKPVITRINEMLEEFAEHADGVDYIYCGDEWLTDVRAGPCTC